MLIAEYDYDLDIEFNREEEHEKHINSTIILVKNVMKEFGFDSETAMNKMGVSEEDKNEIRQKLC